MQDSAICAPDHLQHTIQGPRDNLRPPVAHHQASASRGLRYVTAVLHLPTSVANKVQDTGTQRLGISFDSNMQLTGWNVPV